MCFSDQKMLINVSSLPFTLTTDKDTWSLSTTVYFRIETEEQTGLYELYLHNCLSAVLSGQVFPNSYFIESLGMLKF